MKLWMKENSRGRTYDLKIQQVTLVYVGSWPF